MKADKQYLNLCRDLLDKGVWVENERTGKSCLTLPTVVLTYKANEFPILQSKEVNWKGAIAEMIGYINGYTSAKDFRELGTKSWDMNANKTQAWLDNPNRKGTDDLGKVYGAVAKDFGGVNLIDKVINNLKQGIDDRGEIITFWKPDDFEKGCLRPCMHSHQFIALDGVLHLTSTQRSADVPLGLPYNMIQCWWLLNFMCSVTGHNMGEVTHVINHPHIYEDQLKGVIQQLQRDTSSRIEPAFTFPDYDYIGGSVLHDWRDFYSRGGHWEDIAQGFAFRYPNKGKIKFPFSS